MGRARARAHRYSELQIEQNWDRKKQRRKRSFKLASPSPSSSSLPYEDYNGKFTLPKHGRRIQAATNCSFFLSQNQIEQKKTASRDFFFLLNLVFPEDNL
jgi:hypothetical protein